MFRRVSRLSVCFCAGFLAASASADPAGPWSGNGPVLSGTRSVGTPSLNRSVVGIQTAADHIVGQQCMDGGWGWPHASCTATYNNITGPIGTGLLRAYQVTNDPAHLAAAVAGGNFDLTFQYTNGESRFGAYTAYFLWQLSQATGDPQYSTHAATKFFDELTAATYGPSDLDTAGWIASVQAARTGYAINLRPWEFPRVLAVSGAIGNAGQQALFVQAVLDGLNTLDDTHTVNPGAVWWDMIGLAGGVQALALGGVTTFPAIVSPLKADINGITTLEGLANVLAGYQNTNGSWYWGAHISVPWVPASGDEDIQSTAYAVMALLAARDLVGPSYAAEIKAGRDYLYTLQLASGGFESWPGGTENVEAEAEALTVISNTISIPAVSEWGLVVLALIGLAAGTVLFARQ